MTTALIVGLGAVGQRHARNLRRLLGDNLRLVAWRSARRVPVVNDALEADQSVTVEDAYGIESFDTLAGVLETQPSMGFVCNPTSAHIPVAHALVSAGLHVFIEKPLSHDLTGIAELDAELRRRRRVAMVGFQMRFHPTLLELRELLRRQVVGRLLGVEIAIADYLPDWHRYEDFRQSYAARRELGGGVVLTQIHELDYAQWLFGKPVRLFSAGGHLGTLDLDVEDTASTLMECHFDGRMLPVYVHQNFAQSGRVRSCRVRGESGTIEADLIGATVRVCDGAGAEVDRRTAIGFERNDMFLDQLRHFMACAEGRETPTVGLAEARVSLQVALAIRESLTSGQAVPVA